MIESFWDSAYRDGDHVEHWELPHPSPELAALVAAGLVPDGGTALDVGCGGGRDAIFLARCGLRSIGLDRSGEALRAARQRDRGRAVRWLQADVAHLPLRTASVDLVSDRGCFHVLDERRPAFGREVARVLRPGGFVLVRGAARDSDEDGLLAVDAAAVDAAFPEAFLTRGPVLPMVLAAPSGDLDGHLVVLRRTMSRWPHVPLGRRRS